MLYLGGQVWKDYIKRPAAAGSLNPAGPLILPSCPNHFQCQSEVETINYRERRAHQKQTLGPARMMNAAQMIWACYTRPPAIVIPASR